MLGAGVEPLLPCGKLAYKSLESIKNLMASLPQL